MSAIHIHAPKGHYIGQIKFRWAKQWTTVTQYLTDPKTAMAVAILRMEKDKHHLARVLFCTDDGWYEPTIVMTARIE